MAIPRAAHLGVVLAIITAFLLVASASATADPTKPGKSQIVTLHCDQLGTLQVIGEGNGRWDRTAEPMHDLNSNLVLVAYSMHFELTPPGGQTQVLVDYSKPPPQNGKLDVCHQTETDPVEGVFTATWGVSYTGD